MSEEWKVCAEDDGYLISEYGRVKNRVTGKIHKEHQVNGKKYRGVSIRGKQRLVHRLVLQAFVGEPEPGQECRHLDGNPHNNHISNLAWGTAKENAKDRALHGTNPVGERNGRCRLSKEDVELIKSCDDIQMARDVGEALGVSRDYARQIYQGHGWRHL